MSGPDIVERLFAEIEHGDEEHRAWLLNALRISPSITALRAEVAALREAMERAALIVDRNLYRQSEKVEDVPRILRAALERTKP